MTIAPITLAKWLPSTIRALGLETPMTDLPEALFANPAWHALKTRHCHFAISAGDACRYPADVAPFAAVAAPTIIALQQLHSLLLPGNSVWLIGERYAHTPGLCFEGTLECLQMTTVPVPLHIFTKAAEYIARGPRPLW